MEVVGSKFEDVALSGDVVYFEFCLHEMADPQKALTHAKNLARDTVVFDHSPDSEWISTVRKRTRSAAARKPWSASA